MSAQLVDSPGPVHWLSVLFARTWDAQASGLKHARYCVPGGALRQLACIIVSPSDWLLPAVGAPASLSSMAAGAQPVRSTCR